jgi:predicted  nucleic acid-binding Zn-ribbon protein
MSINLRLPNITGASEREQLSQMRSYLHQLVGELQWAFQYVDTSSTEVVNPTPKSLRYSAGVSPVSLIDEGASSDPQVTFDSIKALIIKSADIVEAYYEEINKRLEGVYVAQSDFGDYAQKTSQEIEETSTSTTQRFENIQVIIAGHDNDIKSIDGTLKTIGEDVSYQQQAIVTINKGIEDLDGSLASVEGEVIALDTNLQTAKTELSTNIDNAKNELSGSIENAKNELSGAVGEVAEELEGAKTDINGRIDDTNGSVAGLGSGLNDVNSKISDVDEDLQDSKEAINNSIQGVQERVTGVNALLEDAKAQLNGSIEDLEAYVEELQNVIIGVTAYIKSGLLYYTDAEIPVYGLEVGQSVKDEVSGEVVFQKYARFTSEKLSFYDNNDNEVAYISDKKLFIRIAEITVSLQIGGLIDLVMPNRDVVTKWLG